MIPVDSLVVVPARKAAVGHAVHDVQPDQPRARDLVAQLGDLPVEHVSTLIDTCSNRFEHVIVVRERGDPELSGVGDEAAVVVGLGDEHDPEPAGRDGEASYLAVLWSFGLEASDPGQCGGTSLSW